MEKKCITLFCLLLLHFTCFSQQAKPYTFSHYSTANGLAANHVSFIRQDKDGYMWISTLNGLQRFDGSRFITFHSDPANKKSIPSDHIPALFIDKKKRMWITGTNNKVGLFDTRDFTFQETPVPYTTPYSNYKYKYFIDTHDGKLLLYEIRGAIYRYDEQKRQFFRDETTLPLPKGWKPANITWDSLQKKYWIATDSGLIVYNPAKRLWSYRGHNAENDPVIQRYADLRMVHAVRADSQNNICFFQWLPQQSVSLIHNYNRTTGHASVYNLKDQLGLGYHELYGFLLQRNGRTWIYGMPVFVEWANRNSFITITPSNASINELRFTFQTVSATHEDRDGNIWLATDNGMYVFHPDAQLFYTHHLPLPSNQQALDASIHSLWQTTEGGIFISTYEAGLFYLSKEWKPQALPPALNALQQQVTIWDMHQHSKTGKIWFTLQRGDKAVLIYDPKTGAVEWITDSVFNKSTVRQVVEDKEGNLWFGLQGGRIIKWTYTQSEPNTQAGYSLVLDAKSHITKLNIDGRGMLWAATAGSGLLQLDPRTHQLLKQFTTKGPITAQLLSNNITDVLSYDDTTLVAAGGSLEIINPITGTVRHITSADGLPSNTVVSLQKDKRNSLWLGMKTGICRFNLQNNAFALYDRNDGLPYDSFTPLGAFQLANGNILFTTPQNFVVVNPSVIPQGAPAPPVLTAFWMGSRSLQVDSLLQADHVTLDYNNSSIAISFSNLNFKNYRKVRFYYRLEGLDDSWKIADASNQAIYNYIPPGQYTFQVKSVNENGIFSSTVTAVAIDVKPPFWQTPLFYALLGLLLIGFLYLIDNERMKRVRTIQQLREQLVIDLHEDINTNLTDINLMSEMAKIKADKDLSASKDYIQQISTKSRTMKEALSDMLWSIDPKNDSMEKLLLRMEEYTEGVKLTQQIQVQLTTDDTIGQLKLDMRSRHDLLQFYKNALLFTANQFRCPSIHVYLAYARPRLHLVLLTDECTNQERLTTMAHNFKAEMQKRADALGAWLEIDIRHQHIEVRLQLPLTT